jgi:hypothetical protein
MRQGLASYERVATNPYPTWIQNDREDTIVVPGVLKYFDLPDLAASIAPRPLRIAAAVDGSNRRLGEEDVLREYGVAAERYRALGVADLLEITGNSELGSWRGLDPP